ncbi:MAG: Maf family protein, partial [bacterium]
MRKIILASASPRRRDIFAITGLSFKVDASDHEEVLDEKIDPLKLARRLSAEKAKAVAKKHTNAIIIAADTFISFR